MERAASSALEAPSLPVDYPQLRQKASVLRGEGLIEYAHAIFGPRLAILSSFGTESAVLLHMAAKVDRNIPVLFIDTGKLFPATLRYKNDLAQHIGLTNVHTIRPDPPTVQTEDPAGKLWKNARESCCDLRKVRPLNRALENWDDFSARLDAELARRLGDRFALVNGIKGHHGGGRTDAGKEKITTKGNRTDFSPLADYSLQEIEQEFVTRGLPPHPLKANGFTSVGCVPCTTLPERPGDFRSGRMGGGDHNVCMINLFDQKTNATPGPKGPGC